MASKKETKTEVIKAELTDAESKKKKSAAKKAENKEAIDQFMEFINSVESFSG